MIPSTSSFYALGCPSTSDDFHGINDDGYDVRNSGSAQFIHACAHRKKEMSELREKYNPLKHGMSSTDVVVWVGVLVFPVSISGWSSSCTAEWGQLQACCTVSFTFDTDSS